MFSKKVISDTCLIVEDLEAMTVFYRERIGFPLRRQAPGFADFFTEGVTLALWERKHLVEHVGIECPAPDLSGAGRRSISAVMVDSPQRVDELRSELAWRGVILLVEPRWYAWNAYACYFEDPEHHLWEIYAWGEGGHAGLLNT